MKLPTKSITFLGILFILSVCLSVNAKPAYANIPDIEGYVRVAGTNAPVVGVWVKLTNSNSQDSSCVSGAVDQSRYVKTDSTGKYTFVSWTNGGSAAVGEGVNIDTNLDGSNDAVQYPTFDSCDPSDPSPGSTFSCGRDPFVLEVIKPKGWTGNFDTYGTTSDTPCVFCINNGTATYNVSEDLYYHPSGSSNTPTPTSSGGTSTPTPTPASGSINLSAVPALTVGGGAVPVGISATANVLTATFTITNAAGSPTAVSTCASGNCSLGQFTFTDTPGFNAYVQGFASGTATLTVTCTVSGGGVCTGDSETVTVSRTDPWWQTIGSDIITNGNILSQIPTSCISPACTNSLIRSNTSGLAGVAAAGGSIDVSPGVVSNPSSWNSVTTYSGSSHTYDYFENKAKCGTFYDLSTSTINSISDITSLGAPSNGYYWVRYTGNAPLTINSDLSLGNAKVVLFVKNQNLRINGDITLNQGRGFFMAVVGSSPSGSSRNIIVSPAATLLHGLYFVDGQFMTGTAGNDADVQLQVKGSVVAMSRIVLERSLPNNNTAPSEVFEYSPDQLLLFPSCLGETSVQWKELAP